MLGGFAGRRRLAELGRNPATRSLGSPRSLTTVGGCHPQAPHDCQLCEAPEARAVPYAVESLPVSRDPPSLPGRHDDGPLAGCPPNSTREPAPENHPLRGLMGGVPPVGESVGFGGLVRPPEPPQHPQSSKLWGTGGAPPTTPTLLRNQRPVACAESRRRRPRPPRPPASPSKKGPRALPAARTRYPFPDGGPGGWSRHPPL